MHQLDVKSTFLNGPLEEEVYVYQPQEFEVKNSEEKVYWLRKALYGLKQASRAWNKIIDIFLNQIGFNKCTSEHGVYLKVSKKGPRSDMMIVWLYVDYLLVTGSSEGEIEEFKKKIMQEFEMSDLGLLSYFLGIEFKDSNHGVIMHQAKYARNILKKFNMSKCNSATTPIEA